VQRHFNANNGRLSINTETCDTDYISSVSCRFNSISHAGNTQNITRDVLLRHSDKNDVIFVVGLSDRLGPSESGGKILILTS
jgi:hypothetical protein